MGKLFDNYVKSHCLTDENAEEFFECIRDIYYTDEVQGLREYVQHSDINRLDHITSVAYLSFVYAKRHSLDTRSTARAAIMHDLFYYDWHDGDWSHRPHGYRHPGFALKNARLLDKTLNKKEENIILRHMWPLTVVPPKSYEGFVVSISDKYCAARELLIADTGFFKERFKNKCETLRER